MTVFLTVLGIIVALLALVAVIKIDLIIEAQEKATVYLKILFVKIRLYPKKEKKLRISDYSSTKLKKKANRARRKAKAKQDKTQKKSVSKDTQAKNDRASYSDILDTIKLVFGLCRAFFSKFNRYLRLELSKIHVNIACEDAAQTAVYYGAVNSLVGALVGYLDSIIILRPINEKDIVINADFLSERSCVDIRLCASLRVWQAIDILFTLALRLVKEKFFNN